MFTRYKLPDKILAQRVSAHGGSQIIKFMYTQHMIVLSWSTEIAPWTQVPKVARGGGHGGSSATTGEDFVGTVVVAKTLVHCGGVVHGYGVSAEAVKYQRS